MSADDLVPLAVAAARLGLEYPARVRELHPDVEIVRLRDARDPCLHRPYITRAALARLLAKESSS